MRKQATISLLIFVCQLSWSSIKVISLTDKNKSWESVIQSTVENHLSTGVEDTLLIQLKYGEYQVENGFKFVGTPKTKRVVLLHGEEGTIITGGINLKKSDFRPLTDKKILDRILSEEARKKILVYNLNQAKIYNWDEIECIGYGRSEKNTPNQLFCNGEVMTLARYPNAGEPDSVKLRKTVIPIRKIINPGMEKVKAGEEKKENVGRGEFRYEDKRVEQWTNSADIWVDGIFTRDWAWSFNRVSKIDTVKKTIALEFPEKYDLTPQHAFFFATNLLEEIDVPGEYYIDRKSGLLYFYPPEAFFKKGSKMELSVLNKPLMEIGKNDNFELKNLTFKLGRSRGVTVKDCNHLKFINCGFENIGTTALQIEGSDIAVIGCKFHNIGGTAISASGGNLSTLQESNIRIMNCDLSQWGYYNRVYTAGIKLDGVAVQVIGNKLYDAPHGAITIRGNDHLIEHNEIYNVCREFRDFGAIYAFLGNNLLMRGHVIRKNYLHDIGQIGDGVFAIYADESTSGWLIENNLFERIGSTGKRVSAVNSNSGTYIIVRNNLFVDCVVPFELSFHLTTWGKGRLKTFVPQWEKTFSDSNPELALYIEKYPELRDLKTEDKIKVSSNRFEGNVVINDQVKLSNKLFLTKAAFANSDSLVYNSNNRVEKPKNAPLMISQWKKDFKLGNSSFK